MDDKNSLPFETWCRRRGFSRGKGYQLLRDGAGPRTYLVGNRRYVSDHADREWVERMEAAPAPLTLPESLRKARAA